MKPEHLKDRGVYILSRDVANPKPDRRVHDRFDALPVWKQATRIRVGKEPFVELRAANMWGTVKPRAEGFTALVAALEPAPRNFDNVMLSLCETRGSDPSTSILNELVRTGKINLDDIEAAHASYTKENGRRAPGATS